MIRDMLLKEIDASLGTFVTRTNTVQETCCAAIGLKRTGVHFGLIDLMIQNNNAFEDHSVTNVIGMSSVRLKVMSGKDLHTVQELVGMESVVAVANRWTRISLIRRPIY